LKAGTVNEGDTLIIKNIKDTSGNVLPELRIQLKKAGYGITVNEEAYK
jgi:hypothetical protein